MSLAFYPAFPATPIPLPGVDLAGRPEINLVQPVGGAALIDLYFCNIFPTIWASLQMGRVKAILAGEEDDVTAMHETIATAWRVALLAAELRPDVPKPPEVDEDHRPKILQ